MSDWTGFIPALIASFVASISVWVALMASVSAIAAVLTAMAVYLGMFYVTFRVLNLA